MPAESAAERKERLQALRAAAELATGGADLAQEEAPAVEPEVPQEVEEVAAEEDLSG